MKEASQVSGCLKLVRSFYGQRRLELMNRTSIFARDSHFGPKKAGTLEPILSHLLKPQKVLLSSPKGSKCHETEADIEGFLDINSQTSSKESPGHKGI